MILVYASAGTFFLVASWFLVNWMQDDYFDGTNWRRYKRGDDSIQVERLKKTIQEAYDILGQTEDGIDAIEKAMDKLERFAQ